MKLLQTCRAAPEQYNLIDEGVTIGYLRLRHGHFRAHAYGPSGPCVYETTTIGDGMFDPTERKEHISKAIAAIIMEVGVEEEDGT